MLKLVKKEIFQHLEEIFASAAVDEMAGDLIDYKIKLATIANVAEVLGIKTEIITMSLNIKNLPANSSAERV